MLINFVSDSDTGAQGWNLKYKAVNFVRTWPSPFTVVFICLPPAALGFVC
jgi:hypothetical protein